MSDEAMITNTGGEKEIRHRKQQRRSRYEQIAEKLSEDTSSENPQLSTSDPESRHQIVRGTITEVCYTAQTTVDAKHKLLIDYKLTNKNDKKAMGMMLRRAKSILGEPTPSLHSTSKGYHTGSEFHIANSLGVDSLVAIPAIGRTSQAPDPSYNVENFIYHHDSDRAILAPREKNTLTNNGSWYRARNYRYFQQYKTRACKKCPVRSLCTTAKHNGKIIQRSRFPTPYRG